MDSDLDKATGSSSIHFVMSLAPLIKQICAIRRKPGLTRKEYMDYRYRIHGAIVDAPENKDEKPQYESYCHAMRLAQKLTRLAH